MRFVQVNYGDNTNNPAWDQHSNMPKHGDHAKAVDKPVAALLADLKQRGLLDDTIVWWGADSAAPPTPRRTARAATTIPRVHRLARRRRRQTRRGLRRNRRIRPSRRRR